jgi:glycosyltransferase involved in cell wall biosynthesis
MNKPDITIGITAFNAENTIAAAIESALAQDSDHFEVIVVDDASEDKTANIAGQFQTRHPRMRVLKNDRNAGVAAARNRIIHEAQGDFIAFFDDDDVSSPDRLRRQYERITSYETVFAKGAPVMCHTARRQIYPGGGIRYEPTIGMASGSAVPCGKEVADHILFNRPVRGGGGSLATCAQMARTQTYRTLGGFDETFRRYEDTEFCLHLALAGGHFAGLAEPLVTQTMTLASDKKLAEERFYALMLYEKHRALLEEKHRYDFDRAWIGAKFDFLGGDRKRFILQLCALAAHHPFLTAQRLCFALPNIGYNIAFRKLHAAPSR